MIKLVISLLIASSFAATITDRSSTIMLGGAAQTVMPSNSSRGGCSIQNESQYDLWINELGTAAATEPSRLLTAGSEWICPSNGIPTGAISIYGAVTGQAYAAKEW